MSNAFTILNNFIWNDEVVEYLASKFNSENNRFIMMSKAVFTDTTLAKFDDVSFVIHARFECLELSFTKDDSVKMEPIIQAILEWDAFTKYPHRYFIKADYDVSRSITFNNGHFQAPDKFIIHYDRHKFKTEIIEIKDEHYEA